MKNGIILDGLISRTGFCQRCYEAGRPNDEIFYIVYGGSSHRFKYGLRAFRGRRGFVPFLFIKDKFIDGMVSFERICAVHDCGLNIIWKQNGDWTFEMFKERVQTGKMRIVDWNALYSFHDPIYFI